MESDIDPLTEPLRYLAEHNDGIFRMTGHRLMLEHNGERGAESASTGTCTCGWEESGSSQEVVRDEYRSHIRRERNRARLQQIGAL